MTYVYGIDVSKWQGLMNWETAKNAGANYAFIRAGSCTYADGTNYTDYEFIRNSTIAPLYMPVGYYWYYRPKHSYKSQAEYFVNLTSSVANHMPLVCDIETNDGLEFYYVEKNLKLFLDELESLTGKKPLIYTNIGFWHENIYSNVNKPIWAVEKDLWVANFTTATEPRIPITWREKDWLFWQFSADGNERGEEFGVPREPGAPPPSIDLNRFNGTIDEFNAYIEGIVVEPPPEPPVEPEPPEPPINEYVTYEAKMLKVTAHPYLNVRRGPGTSNPIVERLYSSDTPFELQKFVDANNNIWCRIGWNQWAAMDYFGNKYMEYVKT
jgi:lysozyme